MTVLVNQLSNSSTFYLLYQTVNLLANAMSNSTVTVNSNTATGNAAITGNFSANTLTFGNNTVNNTITIPTPTQISNGQFFYNANGSWVQAILPGGLTIPVTNNSFTTTGTSQQIIDSYLMASYHGAEYMVAVKDNNANNHYLSKILTMHDTNNGYISEYGSITSNSSVGTFALTTNATAVILNFTPVSTNTTVYFVRTVV